MIRRGAPAVLALLALVAGLLGLGGPIPAYADGGAQISHFEQTPGGLSMLVSVPANATVDLADVSVTVAGKKASATAQEGSSGKVRRTAVLAIDTSNSMSGAKFDAAKTASSAYIQGLPKDVYLGIVTFGGSVQTALQPTRDRSQATSTLDQLSLSNGTLLYDGVNTALDDAGTTGQRSLLVLSDGSDTRSTAKLDDVSAAIQQAGALVDVVAVDQSGTANAPLEQLAKAGKGTVIPSDPAALNKAFAEQADVLARQVLVTAQLPAGLSDTQGTVEVTLPTTDGSTLEASAYDTHLQAALPPPVTDSSPRWGLPDWAMYAGIGALALGLFALIFLLMPRERPGTAEELVTSYTTRTGAGRSVARGPRVDAEQAFSSARSAAADLLKRNASLEARIGKALDGAGSDLKPAEWLLLHLGIAVLATLLGVLIGHGDIVVGLLFLILGVAGPWGWLIARRAGRRKKFYEALPDALQLMSGSLSAGLSLGQTVDTVVHEGTEPIASEFRRVMVETRLGVELEDALEGIATRFDSPDFGWVVMAIRIQRQVGGNLAELFDTVAATLRERQYVRRQVAALSAEGKLSAIVIGSLPPIFMLYLLLTNRTYLHPLFHDPRGILLLVFGVVWLGIGAFWMSRLVKVEV